MGISKSAAMQGATVVALLVAVGCKGSEDKNTGDVAATAPAPAPATAPPGSATPSPALLDQVKTLAACDDDNDSEEDDCSDREDAFHAWVETAKPGIDELVAVFGSAAPAQRPAIACAVAQREPGEAQLGFAKALLAEGDSEQRYCGVEIATAVGGDKAAGVLRSRLGSGDWDEKRALVVGLGRVRATAVAKSLYPDLVQVLRDPQLPDGMIMSAAAAVAYIGDPDTAIADLRAAMENMKTDGQRADVLKLGVYHLRHNAAVKPWLAELATRGGPVAQAAQSILSDIERDGR